MYFLALSQAPPALSSTTAMSRPVRLPRAKENVTLLVKNELARSISQGLRLLHALDHMRWRQIQPYDVIQHNRDDDNALFFISCGRAAFCNHTVQSVRSPPHTSERLFSSPQLSTGLIILNLILRCPCNGSNPQARPHENWFKQHNLTTDQQWHCILLRCTNERKQQHFETRHHDYTLYSGVL